MAGDKRLGVSRRAALASLGGAATFALPAGAKGKAPTGPVRFEHGVASGDPTATGAILWTRATMDGATADIPLDWCVARAPGESPVRRGHTLALAARDFTAKLEVAGLSPGVEHVYWFEAADGACSPIGRFRTLPRGRTDDWVIAAASCATYSIGLFNAYDAIARLPRVDMILHLGDYIYEYAPPDPSHPEIVPGRVVEPAHEILTLADYRARHAQVKRDPDAQAMHARAAFVAVWDDHETANNSWLNGAQNHNPATEGDWSRRKAAAMQAYFEWMPIRDPLPGHPWEAINRAFEVGDLATVAMVETRLLARTKEEDAAAGPAGMLEALARAADPARELLGREQHKWLEQTLTASTATGKPWQVLGNQVVMGRVAWPDLKRAYPPAELNAIVAGQPAPHRKRVRDLFARQRPGFPWSLDMWDGYPAARERLYASFARARSRPIVLSGDSHASWANDLRDGQGQPIAVEFGTPGVTSAGLGLLLPGAGRHLAEANSEVLFCDQDRRGFVLLTLTRDEAVADLCAVSTILAKPYAVDTIARFRCRPSVAGMEAAAVA
jgi:alkaline phosphatase D